MNEKTKNLLEHMMEDAQDVVSYIGNKSSYELFVKDAIVRKGIVMSLLNIGELVNHLPAEFTDAYPELPWKKMVGMRNLAAHGYHTLDIDIVWDTAQTTVSDLLAFIKELHLDK